MEKNVEYGLLLDYYGDFLTERQRLFMDMHFNQDLSLGEIAEQEGISRQGVRDAILRGQTLLGDMEHKLGMHRRAKLAGDCLGRLRAALKDALLQPEDRWALTHCIDELERALQA